MLHGCGTRTWNRAVAVVALVVAMSGFVPCAFGQASTQDLKRMSLEDLLNVEVTTASKTPEPASLVPAPVYVITQEDIRRSGARSLPEILRLAPGVQVARISAGTYAIGIRGFADRLARSILVMIDGRAVYSPLFAGTYWEVQDTLIEDIDRVEVIRGPGGTLWGANAVNGIINIITKPASATQGLLVTAGGGSEERGFGSVRFGGSGTNVKYRAYGKVLDREPEFHRDGVDFDRWRSSQAGFRADWSLANSRELTVQGDAYDGRLGERTTLTSYTSPFEASRVIDARVSGVNVLARWTSPVGSASDVQVQAYYDRTNRNELPVAENRDTIDIDFQQGLRRWTRHRLTWGAAYRVTSGRIRAVEPTAFSPERRADSLWSAFAQDEVLLVPNRWRVVLGSKIEHNAYSGFEVQPSARALWTPDSSQTVFVGATRAVRTPSRVETDYTTTSLVSAGPVPTFVRLLPNPEFMPEKLTAYEAGYRVRPVDRLYVTASSFFNHLDDLVSTELQPAFVETDPPPARVVLPVEFGNGIYGNCHGAEITADARLTSWWRTTGSYSYLDVQATKDAGSRDVSQERRYEGLIPHHQFQTQTSLDAPGGLSFDWMFRRVSDVEDGPIPAYATSDVRVAWQWQTGLEVAVVGRNLHQPHHPEWPSGSGAPIEIERGVYAQLTLRR
jgi:iron complex outermembrane receptor protein